MVHSGWDLFSVLVTCFGPVRGLLRTFTHGHYIGIDKRIHKYEFFGLVCFDFLYFVHVVFPLTFSTLLTTLNHISIKPPRGVKKARTLVPGIGSALCAVVIVVVCGLLLVPPVLLSLLGIAA